TTRPSTESPTTQSSGREPGTVHSTTRPSTESPTTQSSGREPGTVQSTTCGQAQNGGGSGSGWLWWVRRCWNSFHVVVKVWTSQGVMRSHSSRVCRGGLLRIVQVVVPGSNWVLVGV